MCADATVCRVIHCVCRQRWRTTSAECRERERLDADMYNDVRKASEIHRTVRKYMKSIIKPGLKLIDMCEVRHASSSFRHLPDVSDLSARRALQWLFDISPTAPPADARELSARTHRGERPSGARFLPPHPPTRGAALSKAHTHTHETHHWGSLI